MKKEFRLEKLLEIQIMNERSAAAKLSDADRRLNQAQESLDLIRKKEARLYESFMDSIKNSNNLAPLQVSLSELKKEALALENSLEIVRKEKADIYSHYIDALKKRKILENLKEKSLNNA